MSDDAERLACDLLQLDAFAMLEAWGAPWHKNHLDIMMLEKRWPAEDIRRMVLERVNHPDSYSHDKNKIVFPNAGWIKNMLATAKPGFTETEFLALKVVHLADGILDGHDGNLDRATEDDKTLALSVLRESIEAFQQYVPDGLDEKETNLFKRCIGSTVSAMRMSLGSYLMIFGRQEEAIELCPEMSDLETLFSGGSVVEEAVSTAMEKIEHFNGPIGGVRAEGEDLTDLSDAPPSDSVSASFHLDIPADMGGPETENDMNTKHLMWCANQEYIAFRAKESSHWNADKHRKALELLGNFIDPHSGEAIESLLMEAAANLIAMKYRYLGTHDVGSSADNLLQACEYELAYKYILLERAIKIVKKEETHGYSKDMGEMGFHHRLARALAGMGRWGEAEKQYIETFTIAEKYEYPVDFTGRYLGPEKLDRIKLEYWRTLKSGGKTDRASLIWNELTERKSFPRAFDEWIDQKLYYWDFQSAIEVLEHYIWWHNARTPDETPELTKAISRLNEAKERLQKRNTQ